MHSADSFRGLFTIGLTSKSVSSFPGNGASIADSLASSVHLGSSHRSYDSSGRNNGMRSCRSCNTSFASVVMMVQDSIGSLPPRSHRSHKPGGDEAPTMFKGVAEGGFRRHRLRTRVDRP